MKKISTLICSIIAFAGIHDLWAKEYLIENQRTTIVDDMSVDYLYLGKYTSDNALTISNSATLTSLDAYIGYSDSASNNTALVTDSASWVLNGVMQIGLTNNTGNIVSVLNGGMIELDSLSILGAHNGNSFMLNTNGTLYIRSDFDASMDGFIFGSNSTLSVGGTLSNLDGVEDGRTVVLTGANATWNYTNTTLSIGAFSGSNNLTLENGATLNITNLAVGVGDTTSNSFNVASGSTASLAGNLLLSGESNVVSVAGEMTVDQNINISGSSNTFALAGTLMVSSDLTVFSNNTFTVDGGNASTFGKIDSASDILFNGNGVLTAYGEVELPSIDGAGTMILSGPSAQWTSTPVINVGTNSGGTTLEIVNDAMVKAETITVGGTNSMGSNIILSDGGNLVLTGTNSFIHNDNSLTIDNGGWLTLEKDAYQSLNWATNAHLVWQSGGTFEFMGAAPVFKSWVFDNDYGTYTEQGTLYLGNGRRMILNGTNAYWAAGAYNLHVGDLSSNTSLIITNGALAQFKSLSIGDFAEGGHSNQVVISGLGSKATATEYTTIGGTMIDGKWHAGGEFNRLRLEDGASFHTASLQNRNPSGTSGLEIASGAVAIAGEYYQGRGSYLSFLADTSGTNMGLLVADTAEFEAGAVIGVDAIAKLTTYQLYTNTIVSADTLIVGGVTNGTTADLAALETTGGSLINYSLSLLDGTNILATYSRREIADSAGFATDSMLADISDEIDRLASQGNSAASNQLEIINLMTQQEVHSQMTQLYAYGIPTFMHNQGVFGAIDQVRVRGSSFHDFGAQPQGSYGPAPHAADQGLQPWIKAYGSMGNRNGSNSFNDGYDVKSYGTVLGIDQSLGELLVGVAGGYAGSTIDGDNGDQSDAGTGYGILYGSYGTGDWFADLVLSYGTTSMDNQSGTAFGVSSSVDASQTIMYMGVGSEQLNEDTEARTRPMIGMQISKFSQDGYTEESTMAVAKDVAGFDRWSYQSILGLETAMPVEGDSFSLETQVRAYWLHEFNSDDETVSYTLVGSGLPGQFIMRSPETDVAQLGIGCVAKLDNGWQIRADLDGQVSKDFYSVTLSGALLREF